MGPGVQFSFILGRVCRLALDETSKKHVNDSIRALAIQEFFWSGGGLRIYGCWHRCSAMRERAQLEQNPHSSTGGSSRRTGSSLEGDQSAIRERVGQCFQLFLGFWEVWV